MTVTRTNVPRISEAELQGAAIEAARLLGWKAVHWRPARTKHGWRTPVAYDGKGFFDLTLVHPVKGRLLFVEFKTDKGKLSAEQAQWFESMEAVTVRCDLVECHLWSPRDWPERILEVLS